MSNRLGLGFCLFEKTNCPCVCLHDFSRSVFSIFTIRSGFMHCQRHGGVVCKQFDDRFYVFYNIININKQITEIQAQDLKELLQVRFLY